MSLSETRMFAILKQLPTLSVAIVGDFFLDKYFEIDAKLTEKSIETGLDAYQVARVRTSPGAAGTVANNLSALGVGRILALTVIGNDGEGFELRQELAARRIDLTHVVMTGDRRTPTYIKPMLHDEPSVPRELNRLDIKNRQAMPRSMAREITERLDQVVSECDAVIIADQETAAECGVITEAVRNHLAMIGRRYPNKLLFADSRARIGEFREVIVKPNRSECLSAAGCAPTSDPAAIEAAAKTIVGRTQRAVYCTLGDEGILYVDNHGATRVPGYRVNGPIDIVGAGDSTTAGIVCALCTGATPVEAAAMGNLIASVTIQQIGMTGTATPAQVQARWREVQQK